ncbi:hypothetical protein Glove_137g138 [Diversispora epigaea]|uniref:Uncharacterized protein n=1 Tax=Diversispora epigaea TaxID=1348612 RepID=A0A397J638_9GLOM|nr:hypothetical protein Glove_137g138 [Diversispora epigaea]
MTKNLINISIENDPEYIKFIICLKIFGQSRRECLLNKGDFMLYQKRVMHMPQIVLLQSKGAMLQGFIKTYNRRIKVNTTNNLLSREEIEIENNEDDQDEERQMQKDFIFGSLD